MDLLRIDARRDDRRQLFLLGLLDDRERRQPINAICAPPFLDLIEVVLPAPKSDVVYWDAGCPGFGVKVTPKGRKVFIVLYRTGGAGSRLRKYTIGPYGRVTLHQARVAAQKVFTAKLEGRDPAAEKREAKRRIVADRVEDLLEAFIAQRLSQNRSGGEIARLLRREIGRTWAGRSIHEIGKRGVVEVVTAIAQRGAPVANSTLESGP
jgi:Arm DNA-binding domain